MLDEHRKRMVAGVIGLLLAAMALTIFVVVAAGHTPKAEYCDSKYEKKDLHFVRNLEICMATTACAFDLERVDQYQKANARLDICLEKRKVAGIQTVEESTREYLRRRSIKP